MYVDCLSTALLFLSIFNHLIIIIASYCSPTRFVESEDTGEGSGEIVWVLVILPDRIQNKKIEFLGSSALAWVFVLLKDIAQIVGLL